MKPACVDILDQCISDVRAGRKSLADCVREHPEYRRELKELLPVALSIRAGDAAPDPHRRMLARHAFVETLAREKATAKRGWLPFRFGTQPLRLAAMAFNLVAVLVITTSAVATAKEAQPGDLLYGLKTGLEQVQVVAALTPETKAQIRLGIARERLAEVQRALASDKPAAADTAATAYAATMDQAQRDIEHVRATGSPVDSLHRSVQENLSRQQEVLVQATEKGATGAEHAIREVQETVPPPPISGSVTSNGSTPQPTMTAVSGSVVVITDGPTSQVESASSSAEALRRLFQLAEMIRPTVVGTLTPDPTGSVVPTPSVVTAQPTVDLQSLVASIATPPPTFTVGRPTPDAEDPTRTPIPTSTRRPTVTPSITISPTPGTITPEVTTTVQSIQRRGLFDGTPEEGKVQPTGTAQVGGGVNAAVRTATATFGPTSMPTQIRARATTMRSSAPSEIGVGKLYEGPTRQ